MWWLDLLIFLLDLFLNTVRLIALALFIAVAFVVFRSALRNER